MSSQVKCIVCQKNMHEKHRVISCKLCKQYIHKKCSKLSRKSIALLKLDEYEGNNCLKSNEKIQTNENVELEDSDDDNVDVISDPEDTIQASDIDIDKYDKIMFNPIRFQNSNKDDEFMGKSKYTRMQLLNT